MKNFLTIIVLCLLTVVFSSCTRHPCVGEWKGLDTRNDRVTRGWTIVVKNNGTCYAQEVGVKGADYEELYGGRWTPVNDDIIKLDLNTGEKARKSTYSTHDKLLGKDRGSIYKYTIANLNRTLYLRKDGALESSPENMGSRYAIWLQKQ